MELAHPEHGKVNPMAQEQDIFKKWSQLVAQVWTDDKLKNRLMTKPAAVLQEHGIDVPPGLEVRVVENTDKVYYITLPPKPQGDIAELTSAQMSGVVGGAALGFFLRDRPAGV